MQSFGVLQALRVTTLLQLGIRKSNIYQALRQESRTKKSNPEVIRIISFELYVLAACNSDKIMRREKCVWCNELETV